METLKEVLREFGIPTENTDFEPVSQGLINTTYFVCFGGSKKFVLQKINENVFPNSIALFGNLEKTLPHFTSPDYRRVEYHRASNGKIFFRSNSHDLWRLMSYIPGSVSFHTTSDIEIAFEAGRILGLFHEQLSSMDPGELTTTLDKFHSLPWRMKQYKEALNGSNPKDRNRTTDLQDLIEEFGHELEKLDQMNLPIRVCHNDTKLNNMLFSQDGKGLCLIDLDTLMPGFMFYDFGDAIRTLANPAAEEETDLDKIDFSMEMFDNFVDGLALGQTKLTQEEIESLSLGPVYMPFLHGLRAFTDFLLGNVYYKVKYPDENLDRARSLFHFATLAHDKVPLMQKSIAIKLK